MFNLNMNNIGTSNSNVLDYFKHLDLKLDKRMQLNIGLELTIISKKNNGKLIPMNERNALSAVDSMLGTLSKILGYFLITGSAIGLFRIYDAYTDPVGLLAKINLNILQEVY